MDREDEVQDGSENEQCYYLDGSPAPRTESDIPRPGVIKQTVEDIVNYFNPFDWFRRKTPVTRSVQQQQQSRRNPPVRAAPPVRPAPQMSPERAGRPVKRQRAAGFEFGRNNGAEDEMSPNEVAEDRPPARFVSSESFLTEDEDDSDVEMSGAGVSAGRRVVKSRQGSERSSVGTSSNLSSTTASKRAPLTERKDLTTPLKSGSPRSNTLLPLLSNSKPGGIRHPLMEQTKFQTVTTLTQPSPGQSRKRNFDAVDQEEVTASSATTVSSATTASSAGSATTLPKLFSTFPKASDRSSGPVAISRFTGVTKSVDGPSVSKLAAPYYASKRYDSLLSNDGRMSPSFLPPMKPLPPLTMRPFLQPSNVVASHIPRLHKSVKLDYSYVVPAVKTASVAGMQEFVFQSAPIVPFGEVKAALDKFAPASGARDCSESSRQSSRSPSTFGCLGCGIAMRNFEQGGRCDLCVQLKSGRDQQEATIDSPATPLPKESSNKLRPSTGPRQEIFDVDDETWTCGLCAKPNLDKSSACQSCGKPKKAGEPVSQLPSAQKDRRQSTPLASTQPAQYSRTEDSSSRGGEPPAKRSSAGQSDKAADSSSTTPAPPANKTVSEPAPAAAPQPAGFIDIWSKAATAKTWSCPDCFSASPETVEVCPACGGAKPGTVAKPKEAVLSASTSIPSSLFGAPQPGGGLSKPTGATQAASIGGFSFGTPLTTAKPAETTAPAVPSSVPLFSFGIQPAAPALGAPTSGIPPPTAFSGFSGLSGANTAASSTGKSLDSSKPSSTGPSSLFSGLSNGAASHGGIPAPSAPTPSAGLISFGQSTTNATPGPFGGFAANTSSVNSAPSVAGSTFASGLSSFGGASAAGVAKPSFSFGGQNSAAPPSGFTGFGSLNGSQPSSIPIFGSQNGLGTQTNGISGPSAPQTSLFPATSFGASFAPGMMQNGQASSFGGASGLPAPGTFGGVAAPGAVGTMGALGSPRRMIRAKRNLNAKNA